MAVGRHVWAGRVSTYHPRPLCGWVLARVPGLTALPHPGLILDINTSSMRSARASRNSLGTPRKALTPAIRSTVKLWFRDSPSSRCGATTPGCLSTPPTYCSAVSRRSSSAQLAVLPDDHVEVLAGLSRQSSLRLVPLLVVDNAQGSQLLIVPPWHRSPDSHCDNVYGVVHVPPLPP